MEPTGCMLQTRPVYYTPDPWEPDERYEIATLFRCSHTQGVGELAWGHREAWPHLRPQDHVLISIVMEDLDGESCWSELPASVGPHVTLGDIVDYKAKEE